jgi:hypothetical protein
LRQNVLQRHSKFAKASGLRPWTIFFFVDVLRKQSATPARALIQAGQQLLAEDAPQRVNF